MRIVTKRLQQKIEKSLQYVYHDLIVIYIRKTSYISKQKLVSDALNKAIWLTDKINFCHVKLLSQEEAPHKFYHYIIDYCNWRYELYLHYAIQFLIFFILNIMHKTASALPASYWGHMYTSYKAFLLLEQFLLVSYQRLSQTEVLDLRQQHCLF